ncbi:MAG: hypothetical protein ACI9R3_004935, partial [Verrucomicrobiales bacterium]
MELLTSTRRCLAGPFASPGRLPWRDSIVHRELTYWPGSW